MKQHTIAEGITVFDFVSGCVRESKLQWDLEQRSLMG